jgi:hypothetical protein
MSTNKLITIMGSIIGALLGALLLLGGWIAWQVWDMNPKVTETARRVDRIVDVLPDVKIRIAQEDLQKRVRLALLTAEPTEVRAGEWAAMVELIDFESGKGTIFSAKVKGPDDPNISYLVSGLADATTREKISFFDCSYASSQVGKATAVPEYLDATASYALIKASPRYRMQLRRLFGDPIKEKKIEKKNLKLEQLLEELAAKESLYRPTP